ncbi:hypothetical protein [Persicirhabdus sediminis]|uniref:Uncharacterized protein n=1 Tax=Persicirhabdus sediminis TaxID=454144 RepID=A0A8J7MG47_9BACT|nr:hypothetical protein [Persicirhabdus sediminis]MBK1792181.1 hypothetical protein [Persicirhabdus sediminis]
MKKMILSIGLVCTALFGLSTSGLDARPHGHGGHGHQKSHTYVSGHTACGCKIYTKRVVSHYQRCGSPVYRYYAQPVNHSCRSHCRPVRPQRSHCGSSRPSRHGAYNNGGYYKPSSGSVNFYGRSGSISYSW